MATRFKAIDGGATTESVVPSGRLVVIWDGKPSLFTVEDYGGVDDLKEFLESERPGVEVAVTIFTVEGKRTFGMGHTPDADDDDM